MPDHSGFIHLNNADFYYEITGSGPPVVLLHAGIADSRMWDSQFEALAAGNTVVRYDLRGFGRSAPVPGPFSHTADLRALLDALRIEQPSLVGCSMGSRTALDYALSYPDGVDRLVLTSPAVSGFRHTGPPPPQAPQIDAAEEAGDLARVNELEIQVWVDGPRRTPAQVAAWVRRLALDMNAVALANEGVGDEQLPPPVEGRLDGLRAPALLVVGEEDTDWTRAAADWLMANLHIARRVDLPDAAHLPNMEQPAAYNAAVLAFLAGG